MERHGRPGVRRALSQDEHERINAEEYPGTRQLCFSCGGATGRTVEDAILDQEGNPLCEECAASEDRKNLTALVDSFSYLMRERLHQKVRAGYKGWDDPDNSKYLFQSMQVMISKARNDPSKWVDVANFAAMLWHLDKYLGR